jgi:hypothetical protein
MDKPEKKDTFGILFDLEDDFLKQEYFLSDFANLEQESGNNSDQNPVSPVVSNSNSNQNPVDPVVSNNNSNPDPLTRFKEILAALKIEKDKTKVTALRIEHDQIFQRLFIKNSNQNHATNTFPNWNNNNNKDNNHTHQKTIKKQFKKR